MVDCPYWMGNKVIFGEMFKTYSLLSKHCLLHSNIYIIKKPETIIGTLLNEIRGSFFMGTYSCFFIFLSLPTVIVFLERPYTAFNFHPLKGIRVQCFLLLTSYTLSVYTFSFLHLYG